MAGYKLSDKKSSDIRKQLGIFNINDKLTQYKINGREHIKRMDDNRLPQKILQTGREKKYRKTYGDREMISGRKKQAKGPKAYI